MTCIQPGRIYALINVKSGTCLDLSGDDNRSTIGYPFHNSPNQGWMFERQGNGNFWIKSASGLYLRVEGGVGNGAKVEVGLMQYDWKIQDDSSVHQGIRVSPPGKWENLDLHYGNSTPGTRVHLWCGSASNQLWRLQEIDK
ncbi:carbohydrate-binding module family 13 protein [Scleroderma citrinum Foug A]|uniref:Carbohydrate-binding module family 13 protein n=1 Tax=Scleroderma citrinum Foug A TaxID=1036808 RepID=A0A0C3DVN7_9AGAM|nr:carbohydrate-binding module family 13 protein [Scleroderma citrinum Foug A]